MLLRKEISALSNSVIALRIDRYARCDTANDEKVLLHSLSQSSLLVTRACLKIHSRHLHANSIASLMISYATERKRYEKQREESFSGILR